MVVVVAGTIALNNFSLLFINRKVAFGCEQFNRNPESSVIQIKVPLDVV